MSERVREREREREREIERPKKRPKNKIKSAFAKPNYFQKSEHQSEKLKVRES